MRTVNSAYFTKLQADGLQIVELIDLETRNQSFRWTTANGPITYTLSGAATVYQPFPGGTPRGVEESSDLGVSVIDFVLANTGDVFRKLMESDDLAAAVLKVGRVFADTPDLGRMEIFNGTIGDYSYDRNVVRGQARNIWKSASPRWPYLNYHDKCAWRFGSTGCGFNTASITLVLPVNSIEVGSCTTISILVKSGTLSASYANGRFDFGRLTVTDGVNSGHIRTIRTHTADLLSLSHPLPVNSFAFMAVSIFPGCKKRLIDDCKSLYNNDTNFLGFPWIPIQETAF
jgi:uncharacterized phage protein (TIGR02218 family)